MNYQIDYYINPNSCNTMRERLEHLKELNAPDSLLLNEQRLCLVTACAELDEDGWHLFPNDAPVEELRVPLNEQCSHKLYLPDDTRLGLSELDFVLEQLTTLPERCGYVLLEHYLLLAVPPQLLGRSINDLIRAIPQLLAEAQAADTLFCPPQDSGLVRLCWGPLIGHYGLGTPYGMVPDAQIAAQLTNLMRSKVADLAPVVRLLMVPEAYLDGMANRGHRYLPAPGQVDFSPLFPDDEEFEDEDEFEPAVASCSADDGGRDEADDTGRDEADDGICVSCCPMP